MSNKQTLIDYLSNERESAIKAGDYRAAYNLTCWLNFVNRKATRADLRMVAYQVKQDQANKPAAQLTLF